MDGGTTARNVDGVVIADVFYIDIRVFQIDVWAAAGDGDSLGVVAFHQVVAIVTDFACDFLCILGYG